MLRSCIIAFAFLFPYALRAQEWEPAGAEVFSAIAGPGDGALLLLRYPGDILRSTDTGGTWQVVYHGVAQLDAFRLEGNALTAYGDSSDAVVSRDSGRTWQVANDGWRIASEKPFPPSLYPLPIGSKSVAFADSEYFAVGTPGMICVWDAMVCKWRTLHRAPFRSLLGTPPPPSPLLLAEEGETKIDFSSAAHGAITIGNRIYFTNDSAVTWSETILPDTAPISSFYLLSDTSTLIGMRDGRLYYHSPDAERGLDLLRCDSILNTTDSTAHPILQIGWKDKLDVDLFVLTDSMLYSVRSDLSSIAPYALPLAAGERAIAASFPDAYTGFLLTDSQRRFDTLTADGHDTTILFDTCKVYRSLDGGANWNVVLKNIPSLTNLYFENTKTGFLCSANGLILHTEDTGSRWARGRTNMRQNLHDINFVNETTGYTVGDSGVVLFTQTSGRFWRPLPPEPLFTHPGTSYTGVGFADYRSSGRDEATVYIVASDRAYKAAIPQPLNVHPHWHWPERHMLSVTEHPNPASGIVHFDIRGASNASYEPTLRICDLRGNKLSEASSIDAQSPGEWSAQADLSFLAPGAYTAIASDGSEQAMCKFLIER